MRPKPVSIHPAALDEAQAAIDWYRARSMRAAWRFLDELSSAIERISKEPAQFPVFDFGTRRCVLPRFPYLVIFREASSELEVLAVAHARRAPGYWRDRVQ